MLLLFICRLFDVLNSANPYGRGYKAPLRPQCVWQPFLNEMEVKLKNLLMPDGSAVAAQPRIGALGLIVDIKSISSLAKELFEGPHTK